MKTLAFDIGQVLFTNHPGAARISSSPAALISYLLPNIMALAGIVFFLLILGGGFMMVAGAGGSPSAQDQAKAKAALTYGIVGFLLVVSAYFILQIISTLTGVDLINIPRFP